MKILAIGGYLGGSFFLDDGKGVFLADLSRSLVGGSRHILKGCAAAIIIFPLRNIVRDRRFSRDRYPCEELFGHFIIQPFVVRCLGIFDSDTCSERIHIEMG